MKLTELNKIYALAKRIGIKTFGELQNFQQRLQQPNQNILQALVSYNNELGEDFEIGGE